jgi:hypothetical protein
MIAEVINTPDGYNHVDYHDKVDIESTLPLHVRPICHPKNKKLVIGAIEMVNKKGILGRSVANSVTMDMMSCEILEVFT